MEEENLYREAMENIRELAEDIISECISFAETYDYEKIWVLDRFQEEFAKIRRTKKHI